MNRTMHVTFSHLLGRPAPILAIVFGLALALGVPRGLAQTKTSLDPNVGEVNQAMKEAKDADKAARDPKNAPKDGNITKAEKDLDKAEQTAKANPTKENQKGAKDAKDKANDTVKNSPDKTNSSGYREKLKERRESRERLRHALKRLVDAYNRAQQNSGVTLTPETHDYVKEALRKGKEALEGLEGPIAMNPSGYNPSDAARNVQGDVARDAGRAPPSPPSGGAGGAGGGSWGGCPGHRAYGH